MRWPPLRADIDSWASELTSKDQAMGMSLVQVIFCKKISSKDFDITENCRIVYLFTRLAVKFGASAYQ